ncbi:NAD(P)H-dependent oxidoreductase [Pseudooceanicola algae]|uniref:FMN-dependent NADH-azoreductase n=1 Tax=Pseudooceanicola algae TaxID=1537215 RepID=A0A418SD98_9RHOB|nr:NAD(P)H-dependent oxidoreductase [Pseudooceanicola algae]QPM92322.1 FMN-dependent NADH-azoreductase [Pseudooceanicola algae]
MKALVIFAHPVPESFSSALHRKVVDTLTARGWEVDDWDLNAEGFDPVLSCEERRNYQDTESDRSAVQPHVDRIMQADALVLVFPVWNFGFPAILKGVFDRIFLPGVSFRLEDGFVKPNLTHIKKLAAVTTYGGTRWRAFGAGDPPRKIVKRAVWHVTRPEKTRYLALYDMNRNSEETRKAFLDKVGREMDAL